MDVQKNTMLKLLRNLGRTIKLYQVAIWTFV